MVERRESCVVRILLQVVGGGASADGGGRGVGRGIWAGKRLNGWVEEEGGRGGEEHFPHELLLRFWAEVAVHGGLDLE